MSLAMEMAAVSNSILALVNPHHDAAPAPQEEEEELDEEEESFERSQDHKQTYRGDRLTECRSFVA